METVPAISREAVRQAVLANDPTASGSSVSSKPTTSESSDKTPLQAPTPFQAPSVEAAGLPAILRFAPNKSTSAAATAGADDSAASALGSLDTMEDATFQSLLSSKAAHKMRKAGDDEDNGDGKDDDEGDGEDDDAVSFKSHASNKNTDKQKIKFQQQM